MTASASIPGEQPAQRATGPEHNAFSSLSEDEALALLKSLVLTTEDVDRLSKHPALIKSRKVKFAIAIHPCTPRHVSIPLVRHLFTFDLMRVALTPVVPADVKVAAEESLINRLETLSEGEKLSLAKRASGRVASALLLEREPRVRRAALENPRLTESAVIKAVTRYGATAGLIQTVCHHPKWSVRGEVRIALLRAEKTPLSRALEFARSLPIQQVHDVLHGSHLPLGVKTLLLQDLARRAQAISS